MVHLIFSRVKQVNEFISQKRCWNFFVLNFVVEFEYRLFIDKQETSNNQRVRGFIERYIPQLVVERESSAEMVFGIRRTESKQIGQLIHALEAERMNIGVESYGLSMTTIEEVFLRYRSCAHKSDLIDSMCSLFHIG